MAKLSTLARPGAAPTISVLQLMGLNLFCAVVYFLVGFFSLQMAFDTTNVSPIWPTSGLALGALLLFGARLWPAIAVGAFCVNVVVFHDYAAPATYIASAMIAIGNTLEALLAFWLIRRFATSAPIFDRVRGVFTFLMASASGCLLSAAVGTAALELNGFAPQASAISIFGTWWVGDSAGMLVITPLMVAWGRRTAVVPGRGSVLVFGLICLAVVVTTALAFSDFLQSTMLSLIFLFLYVPCVAITAFFYGVRGVSLLTLAIVAVAVVMTVQGHGPFVFGTGADNASLIALDSFVLLWVSSGLVLAADLADRQGAGAHSVPALLLPWSLFFLSIGLAVGAWRLTSLSVETAARDEFTFNAQSIRSRISDRMRDYEQVLRGAAGFIHASNDVTREEWQRYVATLKLSESYPGIQGVGFAEYLRSEAGKSRFEQEVRLDGFPEFVVKPEGERSTYMAIKYLSPFDWRNQRAHGYDMFSEELRRKALTLARDEGITSVSGKIVLVQETDVGQQAGFLMYLPIFDVEVSPQTVEERRAAMRGVVYSPFRMNDLISGVLGKRQSSLALAIYDGNETLPDKLMYSETPEVSSGGSPFLSSLRYRESVKIANREWLVTVSATPDFAATVDRGKAHIVLISGILISLLLFSFIRALVVTRSRALSLAEQMTMALRESEARFTSLAKTALEAIFIVNGDARIVYCNPAAERIFAYSNAQLLGLPWTSLLVASEREEVEARLKAQRDIEATDEFRAGESAGATCVRATSEVFPAEFSLSYWENEGQHFYGIILRDVTDARLASRRLTEAREAAESASLAKSQFVANMSHEIRTPMNAVLGMTQLLMRTSLSTEQREQLKIMLSAGNSLMEILNDILDFSKIEAGRMELRSKPFNLDHVLDELVAVMSAEAKLKSLEFSIEVEASVPRSLIGDGTRTRQILLNLLGNAIKFTESGRVSLFIDVAERRRDWITLRAIVRDTGIGISADEQLELFSAFSQADASVTREYEGTGLGLAISRELAQLMGGDITLSSEQGKGSTFTVLLPFQVAEPAATTHDPLVSTDDTAAEPAAFDALLAGRRVLLVEDNVFNQAVAKSFLEHAGAELVTASNGAAAVAQLSSVGEQFDVVLMDVQMPVMDGITATRIIRQELQLAIPVLAMTAGVLESERANCLAAGMNGFIPKPVVEAQMFDLLKQVLDHTPVRASPIQLDGADEDAELIKRTLDQLVGIARGSATNERLVLDGIRQVLEQGVSPILEARDTWLQGKPKLASAALHKARGSVSQVGAGGLTKCLLALEHLIEDPEAPVDLANHWTEALRRYESMLAAIDLWFERRRPAQQAHDAPLVEVHEETARHELEILKKMLADRNIDADRQFEQLRDYLKSRMTPGDFQTLVVAVRALHFDSALTLLKQLGTSR
ncbi:CHASE domain-containing protein [Allohahella sp. A8]|uniref:CHASE domain-containing protein n=1 Tax=Allohahella sp. A8 TaxID=3141461 RepID=UPI003A80BEBD